MYDLSSILTNYPKLNGLEQQIFINSQFLRGMNLGVTLAWRVLQGAASLRRCWGGKGAEVNGWCEQSGRISNQDGSHTWL